MITATGWTFDILNETSFSDLVELLAYWAEEPPAHVLLALRYLGPRKAARKGPTEEDAKRQMGELSRVFGQQAQPLPAHLKDLIRSAEQLKQQHKGL